MYLRGVLDLTLLDNPAGRLYDILSESRSKPRNKRAKEVWGEVFEINSTDLDLILYKVAELIQLVKNTKKTIEQLENVQHEIYLAPFKKIETLLAMGNLEAPWENFVKYLDEATMVALRFCADTLSHQRGEQLIEEDKLLELKVEVERLSEKVLSSELPDILKHSFVENLDKIRKAINDYRIWGIDRLLKSLDLGVGSVFRHGEIIKEERDNEHVKKYFDILGRLNQLVSFAHNTKHLLSPVITYILGNGPE